MKVKLLILASCAISFGIGFMVGQIVLIRTQKPAGIVKEVIDRSLDKYALDNLAKSDIGEANLQIEKELKVYPNFTSNEFILEFSPNLDKKTMKKVSGMINIPHTERGNGKYPVIVMLRGFVSPADYFIGNGTINAAIFFANNGFITVSPDFLGFGDSDSEPENIFEARFQTYTTTLALLKSIKSLNGWNQKDIFIWGHSNGGQIALTTLEVTGASYPTVLWAPVSVSFPFSILYFTDEADDKGKFLRQELAKFEEVYDTELYSLTNYLGRVKAPIQLNQGSMDTAVPMSWSNSLAEALEKLDQEVRYTKYPGADHAMAPLWNTVIQQDLEFFEKNLK